MLTPLYLESKANRAPLRVGVLIDGPGRVVPRYVATILDDIARSNFANVELAIVLHAAPASEPLPGFVHQIYARVDRAVAGDRDPLSLVDPGMGLVDVDRLEVSPGHAGEPWLPADVLDEIHGRELDVILRFCSAIPRGEVLHAARHGVWAYGFSTDEDAESDSSFFGQLEAAPMRSVRLEVLGDDAQPGLRLCQSSFGRHGGVFLAPYRLVAFGETTHFVIWKLHDLHERGWEYVRGQALRTRPENLAPASAPELRWTPEDSAPSPPPPISPPPISQSPISQSPISQSPISQSPISQSPISQSPISRPPISRPPISRPPRTPFPPRSPTAGEVVRFLAYRLGTSVSNRLRGLNYHWKVALRRSAVPFGSTPESTGVGDFVWIDAPPGHYWADPFLAARGGQTFLFFEDFDHDKGYGMIGVAEVRGDGTLGPPVTCLDLEHHLSFPFVFEHDGETFMIPESLASGTVTLYRARSFPHDWVREKVLFRGNAVDTTCVHAGGRFYFFSTLHERDDRGMKTMIFVADSLTGEWRLHPQNPVSSDARDARNAGAVFRRDGRLFRPAQNCGPVYGYGLCLQEIVTLDEERYEERLWCAVDPSALPFDAVGIHTYNACGELEVVDARLAVPV